MTVNNCFDCNRYYRTVTALCDITRTAVWVLNKTAGTVSLECYAKTSSGISIRADRPLWKKKTFYSPPSSDNFIVFLRSSRALGRESMCASFGRFFGLDNRFRNGFVPSGLLFRRVRSRKLYFTRQYVYWGGGGYATDYTKIICNNNGEPTTFFHEKIFIIRV